MAYRCYANPKRDPRRYVHRAMQKYGFHNFEFEIVEPVPDKALLLEREQHWLDTLRPWDKTIGYNLCPTAKSWLGKRHTEESKRKMSVAQTGKRLSPEHRARSLEILEGIHQRHRRPIYQIDMASLVVVAEYGSCKEAGLKIGRNTKTINKAALKQRLSAFGYYWCYKDEYGSFKVPTGKAECEKLYKRKSLHQIDRVTGKVVFWASLADASKATGFPKGCISKACHKNRPYKGSQWQFASNPVAQSPQLISL